MTESIWEQKIVFQPIGVIHSPFAKIEDMPIQPAGASGIHGSIEIRPDLTSGLADLEGFSHLIVLYHFHRVNAMQLAVTPFLDTTPRGVFSTRAPKRPNPLGLSIVRLTGVEKNILTIENVDMLDGTPVIDIKPYVPDFDRHDAERVGWYEQAKGRVQTHRSDGRFG